MTQPEIDPRFMKMAEELPCSGDCPTAEDTGLVVHHVECPAFHRKLFALRLQEQYRAGFAAGQNELDEIRRRVANDY